MNIPYLFSSVHQNGTITLPAGRFIVPVGQSITPDGVKVIGAGVSKTTIVWTHNGGNGASSGLSIGGDNCEIGGIHFDSDMPYNAAVPSSKNKVGINAIRCYGNSPNIHDCSGSNVDDLIFFDQCVGGKVTNVTTDLTIRGDAIWIGGATGITLSKLTIVGSQNEHGIRVDANRYGQNTAANILIDSCDVGNSDGKESIAVRMAIGLVTIQYCTLRAWSRAGQVSTPPSTVTVPNIVYTANQFVNKAYLQIDQGVTATGKSNHWMNYNAYCPVHVTGPNVHVNLTLCGTTDAEAIDPNNPNGHDLVASGGLSPTDVVVVTRT